MRHLATQSRLLANILPFVRASLAGIGQTMLQPSAIVGTVLLVGVAWNSWQALIGAVVGVLVSTATAYAVRAQRAHIIAGLYGFNGALGGLGLAVFFQLSPLLIGCIVVGALLSALLMYAALRWLPMPVYAAPFILSLWLLLWLIDVANWPILPSMASLPVDGDMSTALLLAVGQVLFQDNALTGAIFAAILLWHAPRATAYAAVALLASMLTALALSMSPLVIHSGIFGFSGMLCSLALAGQISDYRRALPAVVITAAVSVLLLALLRYWGAVPFSAPFVLTMWGVHGVRYWHNRRHSQS